MHKTLREFTEIWVYRIQAFETKCLRKLLCISYLEHKTNVWVLSKIIHLMGPQHHLLATVKRRKLARFGSKTNHPSACRVDNTTVNKGNAYGQCQSVKCLCLCQNSSKWPPTEKTGRGSLLNHLSRPPDDQVGERFELNRSCTRVVPHEGGPSTGVPLYKSNRRYSHTQFKTSCPDSLCIKYPCPNFRHQW